MLRLGAEIHNMGQMKKNDIFNLRLKLLITMCSSYLKDYPLGKFRIDAIKNNASIISNENLDFSYHYNIEINMGMEQVLYQRIKLLSIMAKAFSSGYPMGDIRKKAIRENIENITEILAINSQFNDIKFLKVA
ncbi:MAG: hypothetical protein HQK78_03870 [Desulfobacterales bacterium]|nr:hypothetical protein [Desulfobacterales bacterium]